MVQSSCAFFRTKPLATGFRACYPWVIVLFFAASVSADEGVSTADLRVTIDRSLAFLADEGIDWKEGRKCASCHHAPMMVWALNEARNQGYTIDQDALDDVTNWMLLPDDPAKAFGPKRQEDPDPSVRANVLHFALALQTVAAPDPPVEEALRKLMIMLQEDQAEDGSWKSPPAARPPSAGGKLLITPLTLVAMTSARASRSDNSKAPDDTNVTADDPLTASRQKGLKWLAETPIDDDLQSAALRLLLASRLGDPRDERKPLMARLLERQNEDGGWSQTRELSSDGFATGQTLYVLAAAGADRESAPIHRAQNFLVKSQRKDGTWPIIPRAKEPEGKRSENDGPITYMGTAWATMGLVRSAPVAERKSN